MQFKPFTALVSLVAGAVCASALSSGIYTITNIESSSLVRANLTGNVLYVDSSFNVGDIFAQWVLRTQSDGFYTLENVGLVAYATVLAEVDGTDVIISSNPFEFSLQTSDNDTYVILVPGQNLVWNVEPPVVPRAYVLLRNSQSGNASQRWRFDQFLPL